MYNLIPKLISRKGGSRRDRSFYSKFYLDGNLEGLESQQRYITSPEGCYISLFSHDTQEVVVFHM